MKKILVSLTVVLAFTSQAQNNIKKEKIKALFAVMHQDTLMIKTFDVMTASMVKNMSAMFTDTTYTKLNIDVSKITQKLMERNMQKAKENALKLLNGDMVDIYDKYFTLEEIDDFTVFYKSKSGQKLLNQMPGITKDLTAIMLSKYQTDFQQSLMKDVEDITNEIIEAQNKGKQ